MGIAGKEQGEIKTILTWIGYFDGNTTVSIYGFQYYISLTEA